jgi:hypothetical protein
MINIQAGNALGVWQIDRATRTALGLEKLGRKQSVRSRNSLFRYLIPERLYIPYQILYRIRICICISHLY